jgi:alanyl-tRNA synthetase
METHKLYRDNPYLTECDAQVVATNNQTIELDQTVFYGEAGGQVGDMGSVASLKIVDAQHMGGRLLLRFDAPTIHVGTRIVHIADTNPAGLAVGDAVKVTIDWERRYKIMRMHSAAHLVFYYALKYCGPQGSNKLVGSLKGCRIAEDNARFDFPALGKLDQSDIDRIQEASNEMVAKRFSIDYRVDEAEPDLRYWMCGEIEMYCGGTHVRDTSEIGEISVKRRSQGRGLERIYLELV